MKANELMIGDWVASRKWIEKPFKLITLSERKGDFFYGRTSENSIVGPFFVESFEPIPLTPEILEKNGWYIPEDGLWYRHNIIPFLIALRTSGAYLYADEEHDKREFFCSIHSVHELQHCLKLVGIEKDIVL